MIFHILSKQAWETAVSHNIYSPESIKAEGFIHFSTREQVVLTANEFYRGQGGLLLLCVDDERVQAKVVYEDLYGKGQAFPHVYGALNLDAVQEVVDFPVNADGLFDFPTLITA